MAKDTFTCCDTPIPWPTRDDDQTCPDCGLLWEREPVDLGAGARIKREQPAGIWRTCDDCGAEPGQECSWSCSSNW